MNRIIFLFGLIFYSQYTYAGFEKISNKISGSTISVNSVLTTTDDKFLYMQQNPNTWNLEHFIKGQTRNIITLGYDVERMLIQPSDFEVSLDVEITYTDQNFSQSTLNKTLSIKYNSIGEYNDRTSFVFYGGHSVTCKIVAINVISGVVPNELFLENSIDVERFYKFNYNTQPIIVSGLIDNNSVLNLNWNFISGAEDFELEWLYVNDYDDYYNSIPPTELNYDFEKNSNRIRTSFTTYQIPLTYGRGYVLYRVRALTRIGAEYTQIAYGAWSIGSSSGKVNLFLNKTQINSVHRDDFINWSSQKFYTEQGLLKESLEYFDGGIKTRQTIINNNSDKTTIVQDNIYDFNGRKAITTLPAPSGDNTFHYYANNVSSIDVNGQVHYYSWEDFDKSQTNNPCVVQQKDMNQYTGSSNYYSNLNPNQNNQNTFIPDANGFPFSQVEYLNDKTGRVSKISSPGESHLLNSNHETKYYYAKPYQEQLDLLFGTEAGYASNYQKNVVRDANGQLSVSYIDKFGRIVATSLAGSGPLETDFLESNTPPVNLTTDLIKTGNYKDQATNSINLNNQIVVVSEGIHKFNYSVTPSQFVDDCGATGFCSDCVYDLHISITDECGIEMCTPIITTVGNLPLDEVCGGNFVFTVPEFQAFLPVGVYNIKKELKVNDDAAEYYAEKFIETTTCIPNFKAYVNSFIDPNDLALCDPSDLDPCKTDCYAQIGSREDFIAISGNTSERYEFLISNCIKECYEPEKLNNGSQCVIYYNAMIADVSPGGQYAEFYTDNNGNLSADLNPLSIFNLNNNLPQRQDAFWKNQNILYKNEQGGNASLFLLDGTSIAPNHSAVSLEDFIQNWQPSWANSLVKYHPEYCSYETCLLNNNALVFKNEFESVETFEEAKFREFLNPLDNTTAEGFPNVNLQNSSNKDPFYTSQGIGGNFNGEVKDKLHNYLTIDGVNLSIWQTATLMSHCAESTTAVEVNTCLSNFSFGSDLCTKDQEWNYFKTLYLSILNQNMDKAMANKSIENGCYNICFGDGFSNEFNFDVTANNFDCFDANKSPRCVDNKYNAVNDRRQPCSNETRALYSEKISVFNYSSTAILNNLNATEFIDDINLQNRRYCDSQCSADAEGWMLSLVGCNLSQQNYDGIKKQFVEICKLSCLQDYPNQSSTTPPTLLSSEGYSSFEDVLVGYLGANYSNFDCSSTLISNPLPFKHDYFGKELADTCACNKILLNSWRFNNNLIPNSLTNKADMFEYYNGVYIDNIEKLECDCNQSFLSVPNSSNWQPGSIWPIAAATSIEQKQITVPTEITCLDCIECNTFENLKDEFEAQTNMNLLDPEKVNSYFYALTNFINAKLNYNATVGNVQLFYKKCNYDFRDDPLADYTPEGTGLLSILNNIAVRNNILTDYQNKINLNGFSWFSNNVIKKRSIENNYWACDAADVCNSNNVKIHIGKNDLQNCTINLNVSDLAPYTLSDVTYFASIKPLSCNNKKSFELKAKINSLNGPIFKTIIGTSNCFDIAICSPNTLCNISEMPANELEEPEPTCEETLMKSAEAQASLAYEGYVAMLKNKFLDDYKKHCLNSLNTESFTMEFFNHEYHYTLFYYDLAGNLEKTVAPNGVNQLAFNQLSNVALYRNNFNNGTPQTLTPNHAFITNYTYNSFNQVKQQTSPDGGTTNYWYDYADRLIASQNAEQLPNRYSYTLYDDFGRITEVGEVTCFLPGSTTPGGSGGGAICAMPQLTDAIAYSISSFNTWLNTNTRKYQITRFYYNEPVVASISNLFTNGQQNTRAKVASMAYFNASYETAYANAMHFSYDEHGNVKELINDDPERGPIHQFKKIDYDYELISGNVKNVYYQKNKADRIYHNYEYDADNRLKNVYTTTDNINWDRDAKYFYYQHGPIARTELGQLKVQGIDYAYTINGWLKGVNSGTLDVNRDMGKDAHLATPIHKAVAIDAFGFTLGYFENDYKAISNPAVQNNFEAQPNVLGMSGNNLYNGNIKHMVTAIEGMDIQGYTYRYDQLQRLKRSNTFKNIDLVNNTWGVGNQSADYVSIFSYDANGNINHLLRTGYAAAQTDMDDISYFYTAGTNKLDRVNDAAPDFAGYHDIKNGVNNYTYDAIGNLKSDVRENISNINWTMYGKTWNITKTNGEVLSYTYSSKGHRNSKIILPIPTANATTEMLTTKEFYVRDAQGNVMATYKSHYDATAAAYVTDLQEHYIYGSARVGSIENGTNIDNLTLSGDVFKHYYGGKHYELTNHLGNVQATISDRKLPQDVGNNGSVDYFKAEVLTKQDYYAFGMPQPGRDANPSKYRYGFNGKENSNEINNLHGTNQDYGFRMYNTRLARFNAVDPLQPFYPHLTPYQFASNSPIDGLDLDGLEHMHYTVFFNRQGTAIQVVDESDRYFDLGPNGWGVTLNMKMEDKNGQYVQFKSQFIKSKLPPDFWVFKNGPAYAKGLKVLPGSRAGEGSADGANIGTITKKDVAVALSIGALPVAAYGYIIGGGIATGFFSTGGFVFNLDGAAGSFFEASTGQVGNGITPIKSFMVFGLGKKGEKLYDNLNITFGLVNLFNASRSYASASGAYYTAKEFGKFNLEATSFSTGVYGNFILGSQIAPQNSIQKTSNGANQAAGVAGHAVGKVLSTPKISKPSFP